MEGWGWIRGYKKRKVDQNCIFKYVKFIKGEGTRVITDICKSKNMNILVYVKSHERVDLMKRAWYEHYLMKLVGLTEDNSKLVKHAL